MKLAQNWQQIFGEVSPPPQLQTVSKGDPTGVQGINNLLTNVVSLFYMVSGIVFVVMVLWASYDFITSHGEKENIAKARQKMIWAILGLFFMGIAFVIFKVLETVTGITFINVG
jgi:hypothetical protein